MVLTQCLHSFQLIDAQLTLDFLNFLSTLYTGEVRKFLDQKYEWHLQNNMPGGICDMTALYLWQKNNVRVLNLADAHLHGLPLFDNNLNHDGNLHAKEFEMIKRVNLKKVSGAFPNFFAHNASTKSTIPLACLHFQGKAKAYMKHFMQYEAISYSAFIGEIIRLYMEPRIKSLKRKLMLQPK